MSSNSHNSDNTIICPNCGCEAKGNYCFQCGQPTHLHRETFWGLILHLFEHYFHYDSKFWQTMKALWFNPGKLTIAYWNKQRARYLSPVSLYVFISALYFVLLFMLAPEQAKLISSSANNPIYNSEKKKAEQSLSQSGKPVQKNDYAAKYFRVTSDPALLVPLVEKVMHHVPKIFFFMVPFMALITNMLFYRQKNINFVDHTIFAVHIQTLYFSVSLFTSILSLLGHLFVSSKLIGYILVIIYLTLAIRNVYKTSWAKAALFSLMISGCYFVVFCIIIILSIAVLINYT